MAQVLRRSPPSAARSLFLGGVALLALYLFGLRDLAGVTNALLLGFAGVVFAVLLDLPAAPLAKRMPRSIAVVLSLLLFGLVLFLCARWTLPTLARQFATLAAQVPLGIQRLWTALRRSPTIARALPEHVDLSRFGASAFGYLFPFLSGALALLGSLGIVVSIGAFLCADPEGDLRTLEALVPPRRRDRVREIVQRSAALLRRWLAGSLVTMAIVGVLTALGLLLARVHGWLALGFLAFLGALVPYLGSVVVGVAIAAAGLADSPKRALMAVGVYVVVQLLLGSVISPLVSRASIRTSPTLLLMFQFIMTASFGVLGILLAQPLLAIATVVVEGMNEGAGDIGAANGDPPA
jgi:predicted PurR-regulated permease PerM